MYGFTLETQTCPDGVALDGGVFRSQSNRRFGLKLDVDDLENPLVLEFANAETSAALENFLSTVGFFEPGQDECSLHDVRRYQRDMTKRLEHAASGDPRRVAKALVRLPAGEMGDTGLVPALHGQRLTLKLGSLYVLLLMECAMVAERGCLITRCQQCDVAFLTGSLTRRRSHAKFCSDRCRVASARARQSA